MNNRYQTPRLAPGVSRQMLNSDYWIDKLNDKHVIIMDNKGKEEFYQKSLKRAQELELEEEFCDLEDYPSQISGNYLQKIMDQFSNPAKLFTKKYYNKKGQEVSRKQKENVKEKSNWIEIKENIEVKWGIIIRRANIRAFPTDKVYASNPETIDQDMLQLTALTVGTPLAILHTSSQENWFFVQAPLYRGWIKSDKVAIGDSREEVLSYYQEEDFLVVTGSRVETEPNPFADKISNITFQMGDKIPLLNDEKIPGSIPEGNQQAQSPEGCYVIKLPTADRNGLLQYRAALLARHNDLHRGYLPYTKANLLKQAFKMLGERYGWGGLYNRRDCSRFIMDIYRSVGVFIPRDAGPPQEKIPFGKTIVFRGDYQERKEIIDSLNPGNPIYKKGHVVMYLGKEADNHYVIHAGSGYGLKGEGKEHIPRTVHGIFVMNVDQYMKKDAKRYLDAFKLARRYF